MTHRMTWFAFVGGEMVEREAWMTKRNGAVGFDARCSCGWYSATGGAIEVRVREAVQAHLDEEIPGRWQARFTRRQERFEAWRERVSQERKSAEQARIEYEKGRTR